MSTTPLLGHASAVSNDKPDFAQRAGALLSASIGLWMSGESHCHAVCIGIVLGAFGTHMMRGRLDADKLHAWDVASSYAVRARQCARPSAQSA